MEGEVEVWKGILHWDGFIRLSFPLKEYKISEIPRGQLTQLIPVNSCRRFVIIGFLTSPSLPAYSFFISMATCISDAWLDFPKNRLCSTIDRRFSVSVRVKVGSSPSADNLVVSTPPSIEPRMTEVTLSRLTVLGRSLIAGSQKSVLGSTGGSSMVHLPSRDEVSSL